MKLTSLALAGLVLTGAVLSTEASAATIDRDYFSHGSASCQSALPVFDGNIRKRPMAIGNEGTSSAFITCDTENIDNFGDGHSAVAVYLRNRAAAAGVTVNCTLVYGVFTPAASFPKTSAPIPAGGVVFIAWTAADDNEDVPFLGPATSCALPPGVDISAVEFVYPEEIGALEP